MFYDYIFKGLGKVINTKRTRMVTLAPVTYGRRRSAAPRRNMAALHRDLRYKTQPGTLARSELDTHADTCVAGANFLFVDWDGMTADVGAYHGRYEALNDVPIVHCCTAWTHPDTGETIILDIHQALWFGQELPNSLINPNQIRHLLGRCINDDPTDHDRDFGLQADGDTLIPFCMEGTVVYFESRVPTDDELMECRHITLTSDEEWDPATVSISSATRLSREEEELRRIHSVSTGDRDELSSFEEEPLSEISSVYDERSFCQRMISAINVAFHARSREEDELNEKRRHNVSFVGSKHRHSRITAEEVARKFGCGLETAKKTLKATTQHGIRHALRPLHRRYRVDHLDLHRRRVHDTFHMDTLFSKTTSINGKTCANLFTNGKLTKVYPLTDKTSVSMTESLIDFADDVGAPDTIFCDLAPEYVGPKSEFQREIRRLRTKMKNSERGRSEKQNHKAEVEIRELKKLWRWKMMKKGANPRVWDYGLVHLAKIRSILARGKSERPGLEEATGQTVDISEYLDFDFYDLVWYWEEKKPEMTSDGAKLGYWLGIAQHIGSDMTYWILTRTGKVIANSSVQHVLQSETQSDDMQRKIRLFKTTVDERLNADGHLNDINAEYSLDDIDYEDRDERMIPTDEEYGDMIQPERIDVDLDAYDNFLNSEILIDRGGEKVRARVAKRARTDAGEPVGVRHTNPYLDTREYECVTDDGVMERYTANQIAENIFSQCDEEGREFMLVNEIIDHKSDATAIPIVDGYTTSQNGNQVPKKTTRGWKLLVEWKNGTSTWRSLAELKESHPIEVAEYAVANRIQEEPAFKWWVADVLRKRNRIISKVKKRYWRTTHKFGIRLPHSVKEALAIDKETGTTFWWDAIKKELNKVMVAFDVNEDWSPQQIRDGLARGDFVGYQEITCHMVFDVKMDLTRKARFVANGSTTDTPATLTYSSVVTRESVRIAFLIAALNDLGIECCDITNAYLYAPVKEKIWFVAGPEFGSRQGYAVKVVRALYGLKSSGAAWRNLLKEKVTNMGFKPSTADPDVYMRAATKPDGFEYYEYLLVYVDDVMAISHRPKEIITAIGKIYDLKDDPAGPPKRYLGANIEKYELGDGSEAWAMSPRQYVQNAVRVVKQLLQDDDRNLKKNATTPLPSGYKPELDVTDECDPQMASRYQQLIGVLRWAVELGRIDINYEVAIMSQHLALPRVGHLEALYHMFSYLSKHENSRIVFDPAEPVLRDPSVFLEKDWSDMYDLEEIREPMPPRMPKPRGHGMYMNVFVDANHAGNVVTRRSHSGILIFLQNAPIMWYSKRQNTVEGSTFGSELVAMRIARDMIVALRYKLRSFGIPVLGPARVHCDNQGVVKNTSLPESQLSKKHNAVNYHLVRESAAAGVLVVGKEDGKTNLADILTKMLTGERRRFLLQYILY